MTNVFLWNNLDCSHYDLSLGGCPSHQFFLQLFKQNVYPIYYLYLHNYHDWYNIFVIKIRDLIPFISDLNECMETNIIRWLHHTNTPLFYLHICSWQSNMLKHGFCNLLVCLLLFFPTFVWNLEDICNQMLIVYNNFLSHFCIYNLSFNLINVEKLH